MLEVMKLRGLTPRTPELAGWVMIAAVLVACGPEAPPEQGGTGTGSGTGTDATASVGTTEAEDATVAADTTAGIDLGRPEEPSECLTEDGCHRFDVLFVIDNSGSMVEEQHNVARNLPLMLDELLELTDAEGNPGEPDVHLMVTTTDMGHPLCTPFQKPDYTPRAGAPVYEGCNARIERFTGLDPMNPVVIDEACTNGCPVDVVPEDHFIRFGPEGSNVPGDDVRGALACLGPQGIDGCGYQAPLEAMLRALDPTACWNDPTQPACDAEDEWADATEGFLREDAILVIVLVGDGMDCSVVDPGGYAYFTDDDVFWSIDPSLGIPRPSPAICVNAGVACVDDDGDGAHEECTAIESEVLHPIERYRSSLRAIAEDKEVVMLGALGVPPVLAHNPNPPYQPIAGGLVDLVYREWIDAPYPAGDVLPDAWDAGRRAADEAFASGGLAPGCIEVDDRGAFLGHALPPVREREVCESLDFVDETGEEQVRCCVESICDEDFSRAVLCFTGSVGRPFPGKG